MIAHSDYIVTANLNDFPAQALPAGITAISPDAFVLEPDCWLVGAARTALGVLGQLHEPGRSWSSAYASRC